MKMRLNMLPVMLLARNIISFPVKPSLPVLAGMVLLALSACSPPETVLPGDRIAVFAGIESITPNQDAFDEGAGLPATSGLASATHAGGSAAHAGGHLDIDLPLKKIWSASIGNGGSNLIDLAQPLRTVTSFKGGEFLPGGNLKQTLQVGVLKPSLRWGGVVREIAS